MLKYNGGKPRAETKLKSAVQLQDLLDATRIPGRDPEDREHAEKLRQVKVVLEEILYPGKVIFSQQRTFWNGAERKFLMNIQEGSTEAAEAKKKETVETLMILKYGGVLTHADKNMQKILVDSSDTIWTGLLRLHSTYRHDLKIYNSDEGRVEMSAAAFAKSLLDLEGQLTPILDSSMLDGLGTAIIEMEAAKARLNEIVTSGKKIINELLLFIIIVHSSNYQIKYAKGKTKRERHNIK
ncbi:hypothetical protein HID58_007817 [Brassica napus]|uniref:diphosphoinositol-pentakisphosphate 1-kinase n=1 Tax=Brassica napus TaxID=3708 RepID=A0ABQ8EIB9_BRANA|nr:hypothetical protein HID58_007817 [Brassica napus]